MTACFEKLQTLLNRQSLLTIYEAFIRPHLDYCDIIYNKIFNEFWHKKLDSAQYNAALAIAGAIRGTNTVRLYQELGLELQNRRKLGRLTLFCKTYNDQSPLYLYNSIPAKTSGNYYPLRNIKEIPTIKVNYRFFENSFFCATITEWNGLDYSFFTEDLIVIGCLDSHSCSSFF